MTALAQSALPLKGAVQDDGIAEATPPKPVTAVLAETTLEIEPAEVDPPPPRRRTRQVDPYAPAGIGNSGIILFPSIAVGTVYSDNVNNSSSDPQSDIGLRLQPDLNLESDWVRHSLTAGLDGDFVYYSDNERLNTGTLDIFQRLRLDVRRHTEAVIDARYGFDKSGGEDATEHTLSGRAGLTQDFGPMSATLKAGATGKIFEDVDLGGGITEDNSDRDYIEPSLSLRATFNRPEAIKPYIETSYAPRFHASQTDRNGLQRDSQGFGLAAGVELAAEPFWTGDLGLTYLHRNYKDASLENADAIGLTGEVTWSPTELTRVVMATGTAIEDSTSANSSATTKWTSSIDITHALRDNIDILAGASVEVEDLGSSVDKTYNANVGLEWKLNPVLSWTAGYDLTWLDSGTAGDDYVEQRISTGLTLSR